MALTAQAAIEELINNPDKDSDPNALRSLAGHGKGGHIWSAPYKSKGSQIYKSTNLRGQTRFISFDLYSMRYPFSLMPPGLEHSYGVDRINPGHFIQFIASLYSPILGIDYEAKR